MERLVPQDFAGEGIIGKPTRHDDDLVIVLAHAVSHLFAEPLDASAVAVNELVVQQDGCLELRGNRKSNDCGELLDVQKANRFYRPPGQLQVSIGGSELVGHFVPLKVLPSEPPAGSYETAVEEAKNEVAVPEGQQQDRRRER
jgi:hypothetical protein